ncbi:hypothetical protein [Phormidium nigroviride]
MATTPPVKDSLNIVQANLIYRGNYIISGKLVSIYRTYARSQYGPHLGGNNTAKMGRYVVF